MSEGKGRAAGSKGQAQIAATMSLKIRNPEADELDRIALHCSRLPVRDPRTPEAVLGYDEHGLPG
jgi:hypothetical protein